MTNSQTDTPQEPAASDNEQYQNGLTELIEKKKLGLISQDQYDRQHEELIQRVFGTRPEHT